MSSYKINTFIEKYNINNILKVIIILLILLIIYQLFTYTYNTNHANKENNQIETYNTHNTVEGFKALLYSHYGNVISLKNPKNIPEYNGNQCILELDDIYRIDNLAIVFNHNSNNINKYDNSKSIFIQFMDPTGDMKYLKTEDMSQSPPDMKIKLSGSGINTNKYRLNLTNITDENNIKIYTSKLILIIGDGSNDISQYIDPGGYGYVSSFGIFGGNRSLLNSEDYDTIASTDLNKFIATTNTKVENAEHNLTTITFNNINNSSDVKIYSLQLITSQTPDPATTRNNPPGSPFNINISYNNSLFISNVFNINKTYIIRSDINNLEENNVFIFFDSPIIANTLIFTIQNLSKYKLSISAISINGVIPTSNDITDFKRNVNILLNDSSDGSNICPNINDLIEKQTKTQAICDNLEYQDKVKYEKIRLERNKQYLLKLKNQQEKIDDLNSVIQDLEVKRQARANVTDQAKVLQYQQQKSNASTIRDLANQRLESQDKNNLHMDVNLNYT